MAARAISSGTISFGLVAIPVKLFTAASSQQVRFNMLHEKCGGRVKQQYFCPVDEEIVERGDMVKGYEFAKGSYVVMTPDELKALDAVATNSVDLTEFVSIRKAAPVRLEPTCLTSTAVVAVARECLDHWQANVGQVDVDGDPSALHQTRVGPPCRSFVGRSTIHRSSGSATRCASWLSHWGTHATSTS